MNQFFSFKRFSLLVLKHWADNKRRYSLSVLALTGLLTGWFVLMMLGESGNPMNEEIQRAAYFFFLFAAGAFYASQYFGDLGSKGKGSNFLLVPASSFEKLLCAVLFAVLLFFVAFTAVFYLVDVVMVNIANSYWADSGKVPVTNILKATVLEFNDGWAMRLLLLYIPVQSAFLLGSVYFERYSFIKTIISGFAAFLIVFGLVYLLYSQFDPWQNIPEGALASSGADPDEYPVPVPAWIGKTYRFIVMYAFAPFFWIVAYYRLKEKQV
ncbi:MAG TPA: hypothetical protein VGB56_02730 [Flavisolibacter sp.]|jgi:hypothetical protein